MTEADIDVSKLEEPTPMCFNNPNSRYWYVVDYHAKPTEKSNKSYIMFPLDNNVEEALKKFYTQLKWDLYKEHIYDTCLFPPTHSVYDDLKKKIMLTSDINNEHWFKLNNSVYDDEAQNFRRTTFKPKEYIQDLQQDKKDFLVDYYNDIFHKTVTLKEIIEQSPSKIVNNLQGGFLFATFSMQLACELKEINAPISENLDDSVYQHLFNKINDQRQPYKRESDIKAINYSKVR